MIIVTGASSKGTWGRLFNMPVEGRLVHGFEDIDVGKWIFGQLMLTGAERVYSISGKSAHNDTDLMLTTVAQQRNLVPA